MEDAYTVSLTAYTAVPARSSFELCVVESPYKLLTVSLSVASFNYLEFLVTDTKRYNLPGRLVGRSVGLVIGQIGLRIGLIELEIGLIELGIGLIELVIGLIELGIGLIELVKGLIELGIGLIELGIGLIELGMV